jgi:hypothetical protein
MLREVALELVVDRRIRRFRESSGTEAFERPATQGCQSPQRQRVHPPESVMGLGGLQDSGFDEAECRGMHSVRPYPDNARTTC